MKYLKLIGVLLMLATFEGIVTSCSDEEEDQNDTILVNPGGTASGGHVFEVLDVTSFYLDHIKYSFAGDCLVVTGYDKTEFSGNAVIPSCVSFSGKKYIVTEIGESAFQDCKSLTSISLPKTLTQIGDHAFTRCTSLTSIAIPAHVSKIGKYAFHMCESLSRAEFASIEHLCSIKFETNTSNPLFYAHHLYIKGREVRDVTIPNGTTEIAQFTFWGCSAMTSVSIPESVTEIGQEAFHDCSGLTSIRLPNHLTNIGKYAFAQCTGLTSLAIPESVTIISSFAFSGCENLVSISIPDGEIVIGSFVFEYCRSLTSITLPQGISVIYPLTFDGCTSLRSITIPSSVTPIRETAFYNCVNIKEIVSLIEHPFAIGQAFTDIYDSATLYVPVGSMDEYKATEGWNRFQNIVEGMKAIR